MTWEEVLAAIHTDPDDNNLRLAFADALEANGAPERAEWIRATCEHAQIRLGDPRWDEASKRKNASFYRCKPSWWEELSNVTQQNDRGIFRFIIGDSQPRDFLRGGNVESSCANAKPASAASGRARETRIRRSSEQCRCDAVRTRSKLEAANPVACPRSNGGWHR